MAAQSRNIIFRQEDRDLLIQIDTKLERVIKDVASLNDGTAQKLLLLEENKLDKAEGYRLKADADKLHGDHERRIRKVEKWGSMAIGALALIQFLAEVIFKN